MSPFTEEQKGFVIESLKLNVGIKQIVDDLIEIYRFEVDAETREKLYRRVQKMKTKQTPDDVETDTDADTDPNFLASYSPYWRVAHLRQMLRDAKEDVALKVRIMKEIRVEEEIIQERERKNSPSAVSELTNLMMRDVVYSTILCSLHRRQALEPLHESVVLDLRRELAIEMGLDPEKVRPMTKEERIEEARYSNMTSDEITEELFKDDPYEYAVAKGYVHFGSSLPVNAYDVVEKNKVFKRRCDGVRVAGSGKPLEEGELSHEDWLKQQGVDYYTYDYTPSEGDELAILPDEAFVKAEKRFIESLSPKGAEIKGLLDVLELMRG